MARSQREKMEAQDLARLYDKIWRQINEDREIVLKQYAFLKEKCEADQNFLNFHADVLVKSSESLIKQSAQVLELVKMAKDQAEDDGELSRETMDEVREELEREKKTLVEAVDLDSSEN